MPTWRTATFARLAMRLSKVLPDEAEDFLGLNCETLGDLLHLLPRHLMSGTDLTDIGALTRQRTDSIDYVAIKAAIESVERLDIGGDCLRQRLVVHLTDGKARLTATFFGGKRLLDFWERYLGAGDTSRGIFAGKLTWFRGAPQLNHPAFVLEKDGKWIGPKKNHTLVDHVIKGSFIGLYPQTSKLPTWTVAASIETALAQIIGLKDPLPAWVLSEANLLGLEQAFNSVHEPISRHHYELGKRRLLFDEAFATQVAMAYRRHDANRHTAVPRLARTDGLVKALDDRLPFQLTKGQIEVGRAIAADLASTQPMQRLLQGEVGSGKTVVALRAMMTVVDSGGQAVLMAPTEVLAQQHAYTVTNLLGELGVGGLLSNGPSAEVVVLTGSMTASGKAEALSRIASGRAGIIIGTHALLSHGVDFYDLGLVVVDEQHRFGVEQRNALADQSTSRPHVLVMTATPIPRSVAMTIFGDLDLSVLSEIPLGRADVTTTVVDTQLKPDWVERAWQRMCEEVAKGRQGFIVAPRIDQVGKSESASVLELAEKLKKGPLQRLRLAVLHGRLPGSEKADIMAQFSAGLIDVLVATSLIEVGLDQPNASMMIICDAERFGISQLHQLRGRIGRGSLPGVCLLLTSAEEGTSARERLEAVANSRDGFKLAEIDLAQRREGDVLGLSQSGRHSALRLLRVLEHGDIIEQARDIAAQVVARDPAMDDPGIADFVTEIEARAEADLDEAV